MLKLFEFGINDGHSHDDLYQSRDAISSALNRDRVVALLGISGRGDGKERAGGVFA